MTDLPYIRTPALPVAKPTVRQVESLAHARKMKKLNNDARKLGELIVARKVSARLYKKMKVLQLRGWTLTEIAKFLKVPRSSVIWELYTNTILER